MHVADSTTTMQSSNPPQPRKRPPYLKRRPPPGFDLGNTTSPGADLLLFCGDCNTTTTGSLPPGAMSNGFSNGHHQTVKQPQNDGTSGGETELVAITTTSTQMLETGLMHPVGTKPDRLVTQNPTTPLEPNNTNLFGTTSPPSAVPPQRLVRKGGPYRKRRVPPPGFSSNGIMAPATTGGDDSSFLFCGDCNTNSAPPPPPNQTLVHGSNRHEGNDTNDGSLVTRLQLQKEIGSNQLVLESLLQPITGVSKVVVSTSSSMIQVSHDAQCQVDDLLRVLHQGGFAADVLGKDSSRTTEASSSGGVPPINNNHQQQSPAMVRSSFFVQGICCASEVPSIRRIVRPLMGVSSLQINITTKRVYVQHDFHTIAAPQIAHALTEQGFPATILHAGGGGGNSRVDDTAMEQPGHTTTTVGRTTLKTDQALQAHTVSVLQQNLSQMEGVVRVDVNVSEGVVVVEHDVRVVSATQLCQGLQSTTAGKTTAVVVQDAQTVLAQTQQLNAVLSSQPRSNYVDSTLSIANLTTRHLPLLTKAIRQHYIRAHVRAIHPHVTSRMVKVEHNPALVSLAAIANTLEQYGLRTSIVTDGAQAKLILPLVDEASEEVEEEKALSVMQQASQLSLFVILSGVFWVISLLAAVQGWARLEYAGLLSVLFGLPPVAVKAGRTIRRCEFDANCMMVTAAAGALALGEMDEAASVAFLFAISEYLEARATDKARTALSAIVQLRPEHANVIHPETKDIVVIPADRVPVGCLISVRTGDKIAADGIVVEGTSQIDESSLTGESVPVQKRINDTVSGGGINIGSTQLVIRTTTSVEDSAVSRLIRLVEEAQANQSTTEKMIDGFARAYTPAVILVATVLCTLPWLWGTKEGRQSMLNGLIIIVIACPCALTISTPVTYAAGLAATAQRGIVVKGGASLEALGSVKTVLFDKTGTLTEGKFKIMHLQEVGDSYARKQMLELLAMMEAPSSHPLAASLVQAARNEGVSVPRDKQVREHTILKGEGVTATVDGKQVYVGNVRLFDRIGLYNSLEEARKARVQEWTAAGGSVGFIGVEGPGIIGMFCVTDTVRPESMEVMEALLLENVQVKMLTGDSEGAAHSVAQQVGLAGDCVHAKLLPEDKLRYVESLKDEVVLSSSSSSFSKFFSYGLFRRKKAVLFCGDGVNDAPALAASDVGVSMGEGASLAMEISDVTLMDSNLHKLVYVLKMGQRVVSTIQENVLLSLACKLLVVCLTFGGYMTLLLAIASDVGVMLLVTLNGMKLLPGDPDGGGVCLWWSRWQRQRYRSVARHGTVHSSASLQLAPSPDTVAAMGSDEEEEEEDTTKSTAMTKLV